jgi:hypothetical protein
MSKPEHALGGLFWPVLRTHIKTSEYANELSKATLAFARSIGRVPKARVEVFEQPPVSVTIAHSLHKSAQSPFYF